MTQLLRNQNPNKYAIINFMLLTIDIGNTSTIFGPSGLRIKTQPAILKKTLKKIGRTDRAIVSSVVPQMDKIIKKYFKSAIFVNHLKFNKLMKIKVKNPAEVGADRLVNAYAAYKLYGGPAIVVDFGTATTFDIIGADGSYLGGLIAPGIQISADALHEHTAKLPKVKVQLPKNVIGRSTVEALQAGIYYGYIGLVEGIIERLKSRGKGQGSSKIIATGGYAKLISKRTKVFDKIDPDLTLKGLYLLSK